MNKNITITVLILAIIALFSVSCSQKSEQAEAQQNSGQDVAVQQVDQQKVTPAASNHYNSKYDFTLQDLEGNNVSLSDFAGKVVIVDFWDTWCPPCKAEIPHFIELQKEYGDDGFQMIGVAFAQEGKEKVKSFVKDYNVNYVNLLATKDVIKQYGEGHDGQPIQGIPTTFVMDQQGNVYKKYVGYIEKSVFENDIKALLAES